MPLDVLGAESEGQIGYLLETALSEALPDSEASTALCIAASPADAAHEEQAGRSLNALLQKFWAWVHSGIPWSCMYRRCAAQSGTVLPPVSFSKNQP